MILTPDNPIAETTAVLLDGKLVRSYLAAEEGETGWIEFFDISSVSPLNLLQSDDEKSIPSYENEDLGFSDPENIGFAPIKTVRKYGKVDFIKLG